jgi:Sap, sulfolipid-1-addressing protein
MCEFGGRHNAGAVASILPLALAATVYPTLLAGVIVLLAREKPAPLLAGFLAGGVLISLAAGLIIVFALNGAVSTKNQNSASPTVDLIAGILSFVLAGVLWHRSRDQAAARPKPKKAKGDSWTQRKLATGSPWMAFGAGIILNIPGIWYLDGLKDISRANDGTGATILWILLFVAIMFMLAEVPLVGYAVSPDGTRVRVTQFRGWLSENGRTIATWAAVTIGVYLTVKGVACLT